MNFADRMKHAREASGLSLETAAKTAWQVYPRVTIARIRQLERDGAIEEDADPMLVFALAEAYRCSLPDLSGYAARLLGRVAVAAGDGYAPGDSNPEPADSEPEPIAAAA